MNEQTNERLQAKTPEQRFLRVLEDDFHQPPRVAQVLLEEAQACLLGQGAAIRPGQTRVLLTPLRAGHGRSLRKTASKEVIWTIDAGQEDRQVLRDHGPVELRRVRIQRLLDEAVEQSAVATQEDLAQALHVSVRTIKRDCKELEAQGICLPTRGRLKGIGRGQTHKAQVVSRWLRGETYDQIMRHMRHSSSSVKRYVQSFVRVADLHRQGFSESEIALLLNLSAYLVGEYLAVYSEHDSLEYQSRLTEQIERLRKAPKAEKGGL
jgi:DNA-binding CsgD family transcriptional regulator